jgi:hypothetical protein
VIVRIAFPFLLAAAALEAQSTPGAVLAKNEPHHHLAYEDPTLRVLRVRVPPHDTTLLHEHDPDYFWIALGPSTVVNAKLGSPDATITSRDLSIHYSFGPFAHVARNPADVPFDNITVELLEPQRSVRNLCDDAVAGKPLDCTSMTEHPSFETNRVRVRLVRMTPGTVLRSQPNARDTWVIALDSADAGRRLVLDEGRAAAGWRGGVFRAQAGETWAVRNRGDAPLHVLTVIDVAPRR